MRLVFLGTPDFAAAILRALVSAGHEVAAAVTQPDKPVGRHAEMTPPEAKRAAMELGIPVLQPESVRDDAFFDQLVSLAPEAIVVAAYGKIIPKRILDLPPHGCLNVHASLLPKYRGAAPIQWAILDGEEVTGVTIMRMDEGLDTGDMLARREVAIDEYETGGSLFDKLAEAGAGLLLETLDRIGTGEVTAERQPEESPTAYARMIRKADGEVDWTDSAARIERQIRALNPWPAAWTRIGGKTLRLWKSEVAEKIASAAPGAIDTEEGDFLVQTGDGVLRLLEVQIEGKKRMAAAEFLKGQRMASGTVLGK